MLDELYQTIEARKKANPNDSYVSKLFLKGTRKIAQKLGEEAIETVIAATSGKREEIIAESADLLFHWLVLMSAMDIRPDEVMAELKRRQGTSGLEEKASRPQE